MTTALAIITAAYRESNITPMGQPLSANQIAEALPRLQSLLASVVGFEVGERLQDYPIGSLGVTGTSVGPTPSTALPANVRLIVNDNVAHTVSMPSNPANGARIGIVDGQQNFATYPLTLNGNGRRVAGVSSYVVNVNGFTGEFVYNESLGNWEAATLITENSQMPYGIEYDDVFITLLAMRLNPRYGRAVSAETKYSLDRAMGRMKAFHRQRRTVSIDGALLTGDGLRRGFSRVDPYNPGDGY